MTRIFLIGFMGSGKSTIGHLLQELLETEFVDTDQFVESQAGQSISDIFAASGETHFRTLETKALQAVTEGIVSTGGGIIERQENIQIMKERGKVVYLAASYEEICRRLEGDETRPLWKRDAAAKKKLFHQRQEIYEQAADWTIYTDDKTADAIALTIASYIKKINA